jgi:hypothetical protein
MVRKVIEGEETVYNTGALRPLRSLVRGLATISLVTLSDPVWKSV